MDQYANDRHDGNIQKALDSIYERIQKSKKVEVLTQKQIRDFFSHEEEKKLSTKQKEWSNVLALPHSILVSIRDSKASLSDLEAREQDIIDMEVGNSDILTNNPRKAIEDELRPKAIKLIQESIDLENLRDRTFINPKIAEVLRQRIETVEEQERAIEEIRKTKTAEEAKETIQKIKETTRAEEIEQAIARSRKARKEIVSKLLKAETIEQLEQLEEEVEQREDEIVIPGLKKGKQPLVSLKRDIELEKRRLE